MVYYSIFFFHCYILGVMLAVSHLLVWLCDEKVMKYSCNKRVKNAYKCNSRNVTIHSGEQGNEEARNFFQYINF